MIPVSVLLSQDWNVLIFRGNIDQTSTTKWAIEQEKKTKCKHLLLNKLYTHYETQFVNKTDG